MIYFKLYPEEGFCTLNMELDVEVPENVDLEGCHCNRRFTLGYLTFVGGKFSHM